MRELFDLLRERAKHQIKLNNYGDAIRDLIEQKNIVDELHMSEGRKEVIMINLGKP